MKGFRENKRLVENLLVSMPCVLVDLIRVLDSCLYMGFATCHFRMFSYNVDFPHFITTGDKNTVSISTLESCHFRK